MKNICVGARIAIGFLLLSLVTGCGENSSVTKAREFLKAGMFKQAVDLLDVEINKNPENPELHFLLGQCHLGNNDQKKADDSFSRALRLDPQKAKSIGSEWFDRGNGLLTGNPAHASEYFKMAVKYDVSLKGNAADRIYDAAIAQMSPDNVETTRAMVSLADDFDVEKNHSKRFNLGKVCLNAGEKLLGSDRLESCQAIFELAVRCDQSLKPRIAEKYLSLAVIEVSNHNYAKAKEIGVMAISHDPKMSTVLAETCAEKADKIGSPSDNWPMIVTLLETAAFFDSSKRPEYGRCIWELILRHEVPNSAEDMITVGAMARSMNPRVKDSLMQLYVTLITRSVSAKEIELDRTKILSSGLIALQPEKKTDVAGIILKTLSQKEKPSYPASEWQKMYDIIKIATDLTTNNQMETKGFGTSLYTIMAKAQDVISPHEAVNLGQRAYSWNRDLRKNIVDLFCTLAKRELDDWGVTSMSNVGTLLESAVSISPESKGQASKIVLEELSLKCANLKEIGQEKFFKLFDLCKALDPPRDIKESITYQFAESLQRHMKKEYEFSIPTLKILAKKYPNSIEGKQSSAIFAPPNVGTLLIKGGDPMHLPSFDNISVQAISVEIRDKEIHVSLKFNNMGERESSFDYHKKDWKRDSVRGGGIYILDSLGKKHYLLEGYSGNDIKQEGYQGYPDIVRIHIPAKESVIVRAKFPMISEGSTGFTFISPEGSHISSVGGIGLWSTQKRWSVGPCAVKPEPFEMDDAQPLK